MVNLVGKKVVLRALEPEDLEFLYVLENDTRLWEISGTQTPYSKHILKQYLGNAHNDIYEVKQLRLAICNKKGALMGLIDLFDFDPKNQRIGLGIVVLKQKDRNKGMGAEAIDLVTSFAFTSLQVRQVFANVLEDNLASIHLFKKMGFSQTGIRKEWTRSDGQFKNEHLFQKFKPSCI